jgi:hypothetical protein
MRGAIWLLAASLFVYLSGERSPITYADLPAALREWLTARQISEEEFAGFVRDTVRRTNARIDSGEREHLIYFILQSKRFTSLPPIEPARAAKRFIEARSDSSRGDVGRRFDAFLASRGRVADERFKHFDELLPNGSEAEQRRFLDREYEAAMRFLYSKEFSTPKEAVPLLYRERGLSTDTGFEANFPVDHALDVIRELADDTRLDRALVIGPGLDVAPRTDLVDVFPPQSFQPFAVADSLLRYGLTDRSTIQVHSIDISKAVLGYLARVRSGSITQLSVFSGLPHSATRPLSNEYQAYFNSFGTQIGRASPSTRPEGFEDRLYKLLEIDRGLAQRFTTERLNIITERSRPDSPYDVAVATNVFPYFADLELALALANIASMLRNGGYLIHNEGRAILPDIAGTVSLQPIQARGVALASAERGAIHDTIWIYRKVPGRR